MSGGLDTGEVARLEEASAWILRLQRGEPADALAFDRWLSAAPENSRAYDRALSAWYAYGSAAKEMLLRPVNTPERKPQRKGLDRRWLASGGLAVAAGLALAVLPAVTAAPVETTYVTGRGEHRTVRLADGSTVELNAGTTLRVRVTRGERYAIMGQGEAVFDVASDPSRPFLIAAGDRTVRVVGTQFDVRRRGEDLSVTVAEGVVEVSADRERSAPVRLQRGQRLDHRTGSSIHRVSSVEPEEVLGWRRGRLVYRDQPLSAVVDDLNLQFNQPIRLEDSALAAVRVSGVLVLDDQAAVIRRLALLAPLAAVTSPEGITLRRQGAAG